ncbi:MAG: hypothetical protein RLZZ58_2204 [Pseudomonadota bacterium]
MSGHDMKEPMMTYDGFMGLLKIGAIVSALAAMLVILLIS